MQYENLRDKISEACRAKHDVRHHITLMREYLKKCDYGKLDDYLDSYQHSLPDDTRIKFCDNIAVNTLLLYFAQQAKDNGIDFIVIVNIPDDIGITKNDFSVILGNLLENAVDACKAETSTESRKIVIRSEMSSSSICLTIDNTFSKTYNPCAADSVISTKHSGEGLGIKSVNSIAKRYSEVFLTEVKDGMFCASVLLNF